MAIGRDKTVERSSEGKDLNDLGFGAKIPTRNARLLNHDGTFNVERRGVPLHLALNFYHLLTSISWPTFILVVLYFRMIRMATRVRRGRRVNAPAAFSPRSFTFDT